MMVGPVLGICLGQYQAIALSEGISTYKMHNGSFVELIIPVKNISTGKAEVTSQKSWIWYFKGGCGKAS